MGINVVKAFLKDLARSVCVDLGASQRVDCNEQSHPFFHFSRICGTYYLMRQSSSSTLPGPSLRRICSTSEETQCSLPPPGLPPPQPASLSRGKRHWMLVAPLAKVNHADIFSKFQGCCRKPCYTSLGGLDLGAHRQTVLQGAGAKKRKEIPIPMFTETTCASADLKHSRERWGRRLDFLLLQVGSESKIYSFVTFEFLVLSQGCFKVYRGG